MSGDISTKSLSRRQLLKSSLVAGALVVGGVSTWQLSLTESQQDLEQEDFPYQHLSLSDRMLLFALLPAYLGEALHQVDSLEFRLKLLHDLDSAFTFLAPPTQAELKKLFAILSNQLGRAYLAGVWQSWNQSSNQSIQRFLNNWRDSFISLQRAGYLGLHQLIMGTFYAQSDSWLAIGYQGPPSLQLGDEFYEQFKA